MAVNIVSIASLNRQRLYSGAPGTSSATIYTAPAGTTIKISSIIVVNTTASPAVLTSLNLVQVAIDLNPATSNRLFSGTSFAANTTTILTPNVFFQGNDYMAAAQTTAAALNLFIFGEVYS